jgi:NTP pyrophosphatase (non-canonical NTP hydrolase)
MSATEYNAMKHNPQRWALGLIEQERKRQDRKFGRQDHSPERFVAILSEEVGEAAKEALNLFDPLTGSWDQRMDAYRAELIQVAAVAVLMVEASFGYREFSEMTPCPVTATCCAFYEDNAAGRRCGHEARDNHFVAFPDACPKEATKKPDEPALGED